MLSEEINLVKPAFTSIQSPKKKENLRFPLLLLIFLYLILSSGAAASSNWEIIPENPVVGDIMEIRGTGFEGESTDVLVTFENEVQVVDGRYEYLLEDVKISGFDNSFTVQATGVDDLNVRAKMLLWLTKTTEAKDGIAIVSQAGVPPGTYEIRIDGKSNAPRVKLKITAFQKMEVDSGGSLSYTYDTSSMPVGSFEVNVGDIAKQVELQPAESLPSEINFSTEQNSSEEKAGGTTEGKVERKNTSREEKKSIGSSLDLKSQKKSATEILAGLMSTPKTFIFEDIKPYIQPGALVEIIRNPPKIPSFLLGFAGVLLIGLAVLRKKK